MTDVVMKELTKISKKNGGILLDEKIVRAAENPENPLHEYFTWDDGECGHKWRLHEASQLRRELDIKYIEREQATIELTYSAPAYAPAPHIERGAVEVVQIIAGPERNAFLAQEHERLCGHMHRYMCYLEIAGMNGAIRTLNRALDKVRAEIADMELVEV